MKRSVWEARAAVGEIAEEIAVKGELQRLRDEGKADLAARIQRVSDRVGLGYDIKSFNQDGSDRSIEVKTVSAGKRFFLSNGERLNSKARSNFWFYLVSEASSPRPVVTLLNASTLRAEHLSPTQYRVDFTS